METNTLLLAMCALLAPAIGLAQGEVTLTYQGELSDLGEVPVEGTRRITYRLYEAAQGGEPVWTELHAEVDVVEGVFNSVLGSIEPLPALDPAAPTYLSVQIEDDEEFTPRMRVGGALRARWAAVAAHADDVRGMHIHPDAVSIGEMPVIDEQGRWVGESTGLRGPPGEAGEAGPRGAQGEAGPAGAQGQAGIVGAAGPPGPQGEDGPAGQAGPEGPRGAVGPTPSLQADGDEDGFADWIEVAVGTDPNNGDEEPVDANENGVADVFEGVPGLQGVPGPPGAPGQPGPAGPPGNIDVPQFDGVADLNLGEVVPGTSASSQEQPLQIPDNNPVGVTGLLNFDVADLGIVRLTVDVDIDHPDISQLTLSLTSPQGTVVTLHAAGDGDGDGLVANYDRSRIPTDGSMDDFYGEDPQGVWRLAVSDGAGGEVGVLRRWAVNVNETWNGGTVFAGGAVHADGRISTQLGLDIGLGGDLVLRDASGRETYRVDGQTGFATSNVRLVPNGDGEPVPILGALNSHHYMARVEDFPMTLVLDNVGWRPLQLPVFYPEQDCQGQSMTAFWVQALHGFVSANGEVHRTVGAFADRQAASYLEPITGVCRIDNRQLVLALTEVLGRFDPARSFPHSEYRFFAGGGR